MKDTSVECSRLILTICRFLCAPKTKYMHAFTFCPHWNAAAATRNQTHDLLRQPKQGKLSSELLSIAKQYNIRYEGTRRKGNNWFPKPAEAISQMTRAVHFQLHPFYYIKFIPGKETERFKIDKLPLDRDTSVDESIVYIWSYYIAAARHRP